MYHGPLRTTTPLTCFNDDIVLDSYFHNVINSHRDFFENTTFQNPNIEGGANNPNTKFSAAFLKKSLVYVITETVAEHPYPYFSEKTWKSMLTGVPFMMISSQYSLKQLHSFGFKTFSQWWSEDYDNLPRCADRIKAVVEELKKLSELDHNTISAIKKDIESTVKHNFNQIKIFKDNDIANFQRLI